MLSFNVCIFKNQISESQLTMKKLLATLLLFAGIFAFGQTVPQGINYQAVAIDESGKPIPGVDIVGSPIDDAEIGVRISILENSPTGAVLYQEEHEVLTDQYGMFNLVIGQGLQVSPDSFSNIEWIGDKYLQVELSVDNNGDFKLSAVQQLMSVPYAFFAENAMVAQTVANVDDADADPTNEIQGLSLSNDTLHLSNGGFVVLPTDQVNDADDNPTNELQGLSISNDTIYLSNGGFVTLPTDQVNDADADPSNEIQGLSLSNDTLYLSNGGFVVLPTDQVNDADDNPTNELQGLSISNDTIYLSNGGFVTLPTDQVNDADADPSNEIQGLSLSNDTLYLSNGGFVVLPTDQVNDADDNPTNELQGLSISNDTIYLSNGGFVTLPTDQVNDADDNPTNELQVISIANDSIELSNGGKISIYDVGADYTIRSGTTGGGTGWIVSLERNGVIQPDFFRVSAGAGIVLSGNNSTDYTITNLSNDMDSTNEIQSLSISNDTIFLSRGGYIVLPQGPQEYSAGDTAFGGVIGYILSPSDSGYSPHKQQGIIVSTDNLQNGLQWGCWGLNGSTYLLMQGDNNMTALLSSCPTLSSGTAMGAVESLILNGYNDWTLPTSKDFEAIHSNQSLLAGLFTNNTFWGSTENSNGAGVFNWNLVTGYSATFLKNDTYHKTRPIRYFSVFRDSSLFASDNSVTNELQKLSLSNDTIYLSNNGGSVNVFDGDYNSLSNTPTIPINTSDLTNDSGFLTSEIDGSTTNEIQTISKSGSTIALSDNGGSVTVFDGDYNSLSNTPTIPTNTSDLNNDSGFLTSEVDGSTTNEIQTISKAGSIIALSNNGGSVTVFDGDYNNLSNTPSIPANTSDLNNDSGFLTSEVDGSTTNEIQILSISNDTIFLSSGGFVKLPTTQSFDGDYNNLSNTPIIPINTSDLNNDSGFLTLEVDGSTTNEIQTISKSGNTIALSNNGGSVAVFDGDYGELTNSPTIPTNTSDLNNDSGFLTLEVDGSTTNEIQTISKSGNTIALSNNGGSVAIFDGDYGELTNSPTIPTNTSDLNNDSGFLTLEVDGSTTNEIQNLFDILSENNNAGSKAILNVQRQSIGVLTPDTSAALDIVSTNQGFLPPRMTEIQRDAIYSPATGLIIWCIDCDSNGGLQIFNGTTWKSLQEKSSGTTSTGSYGLTEYITSTTWIVPNGVTSIYIKMVGGGGGGGSSNGLSGCGWGGDGGGGGGLIYGRIPVTPNDTLDIIIGAGGSNGSNYSNGSPGGETKVVNSSGNVLAVAYGGGGGMGGNSSSSSPGYGGSGAFNVGQGLIKTGSSGTSGKYKSSGGQGGSVHSLFAEYPNRGNGGSGSDCPGGGVSSGISGYIYIEW
jgi:penicillin V acylase-like amidase (Ntn superfamily)